MEYVIDYSIISSFFLCITAIFYFSQRRIDTLRIRLYGYLLIVGMIAVTLDIAAAINYNGKLPASMLYLINVLFLLAVQCNGPLFLFYTLALTGDYKRLSSKAKLLLSLPFIVIFILIIASVFGKHGVFYIAEDLSYNYGSTHLVLYVCMVFYLVVSLIEIIRGSKRIEKQKTTTVFCFIGISFAAMLVQLAFPNVLVNTTANALALTMMYHALQIPAEHIDSLTNVFNQTALPIVFSDLYDQRSEFSVFIVAVRSMHIINYNLGIAKGDQLLINVAKQLADSYGVENVYRAAGDAFAVVARTSKIVPIDGDVLSDIKSGIPSRWNLGGFVTKAEFNIVGINSDDAANSDEMVNIVKYVMYHHDSGRIMDCLLFDGEFKKSFIEFSKTESALAKALKNDAIQVYYQPIHQPDGKLVALEALCRIFDDELGALNPEYFIRMAESNGSIIELTNKVIDRVCAMVNNNDVDSWELEHIGINISMLQCVNMDLCEPVIEYIKSRGIKPGLLRFELTETGLVTSIADVRENMKRIIDDGFSFLLDDFGSGYANFNYLSELPFYCVKLDKTLLWNCTRSKNDLMTLTTCNSIVKQLGKLSVCEGVETKQQAELLTDIGVDMFQGYLYSKALPEDELVRYVGRCKEREAVG